MKNPTISVCIPAYNQTKYLRKTICSIITQKDVSFEILVSDDSNTDDVLNLIEEFKKDNIEINYSRNQPSLGSPSNWNNVIKQAKGEFIKIMHHDEWFIDDFALYKFIMAITDPCDLVVSSARLIKDGSNTLFKASEKEIYKIQKEPQRLLMGNVLASPSAVFFHRKYIQFFDTKLVWLVDIEFYIRFLVENKKLVYISEPLFCSVMDDHNITNKCLYDTDLQLKEYSYLFRLYIRKMFVIKQFKYFFSIYRIISLTQSKKRYILFLRLIKKCFFTINH